MKLLGLSASLVLGAAAISAADHPEFLQPGTNADDDDQSSGVYGNAHEIDGEKFDELNSASPNQYDSKEHLSDEIFVSNMSPTAPPTYEPTSSPTTFPTAAPTKCLDWHLSPWSPFSECSVTCGGGVKKRERIIEQPDQTLYPGVPVCPNPFTDAEPELLKEEQCNIQNCPFDCVLDEIDDTAWTVASQKVLIDGNMVTAMKNVQDIAMQAQNGGKECPNVEGRTRYKRWKDHCEQTILLPCKADANQHGCVHFTDGIGNKIGASEWGQCNGGIKIRHRVEKKCFDSTAAGVTMHYKETAKCTDSAL